MKSYAVLTLILLGAMCSGDLVAADATLAEQAKQVLNKRCYRCHGGPDGKNAGLDVLSPESLFQPRGDGEIEAAFVHPGKPAKSLLWDAVDSGYMPESGSPEDEAMTNDERAIVQRWIESGADFPLREVDAPLSQADVMTAMIEHLRAIPADDRPYIRFFTMEHLYNDPTVDERTLRLHRAALAKLLNSLLWRKRAFVDLAEVANTHGAVLAIDIRNLDWDEYGYWRDILSENPYAMHFRESSNPKLRELADELAQYAGADIPHVRLDWFVVYGAQHPLYTKLLDLPENVRLLEHRLNVDFERNFANKKLMRSGFTRSGVSQQNRMVERHEARDGAYWISYDFKPRKARGDLVRFPLGPVFEANPHNRFAFEHDGGEAIFNLPNGLQGYMLMKGNGDRLDEPGPIDVVYDSSSFMGNPQIVNGISCMNCHARGVISKFQDEIRDSRALSGGVLQKVQDLYPPQKEMDAKLALDRERFLTALQRVCGPYLQIGEDKATPIERFPEPVSQVAQRYFADLSLQKAAFELNIPATKFKSDIDANPALRRLGLGVLTETPPGSLKRDKWEAREGTSFMQDVGVETLPGPTPLFR